MSEPPAVPLLDLGRRIDALRGEIDRALARVVSSHAFVLGREVERFEAAVAEYCGAEHAVGCASGSDALTLALMTQGIGLGDEVLCPSFTFFASAGAIWRLGARPVFVDIDPVTCCLDPAAVERTLEARPRARAILVVHLYGHPADDQALRTIAQRHGAVLVHDGAQAIGARGASGERLGHSGELVATSFYPTKNLGAFGDGGLVTTGDAAQAELLRSLRTHGADPVSGLHPRVGLNSRLDALQAAVLSVGLRHLDAWNDARERNAGLYDQIFREAGASDSRVPLADGGLPLRCPARPAAPARHVFHQYVVRVPAEQRERLRARLAERGIATAVYYPTPLHLQPCFAALDTPPAPLSESERAARETLALPVHPELAEAQVARVASEVVTALHSGAADA